MDRERYIVWLCIFGGTEQRSAAVDCSDTNLFLYYFDLFPPGKRSAFSYQIPKALLLEDLLLSQLARWQH